MLSGSCPPRARKQGQPRQFTVTRGATSTALDLCRRRLSQQANARRHKSQATDTMADFESLDVFSNEAPPDEQTDARRRFESFCAAVERLPPLCRRVFVLRKVHKLSHAEISEVLGVSQSTIEKNVAKGLVRCRDYLRELGLLDVDDGKARSRSVRSVADGGSAE